MECCRAVPSSLANPLRLKFFSILKIIRVAGFPDQNEGKLYLLTQQGTQALACIRFLMKNWPTIKSLVTGRILRPDKQTYLELLDFLRIFSLK